MFGPEISEEYERVRDRFENGLDQLTAVGREIHWFAKIITGSLIVIAACALVITVGVVF